MDWYLLGIAPTKDKKEITAAYRAKLRQTNPEDKPEEFKALRQAYEQALALADKEDEQMAADYTPVGLWLKQIGQVYDDYARRIDPACWKTLMENDVCVALDTRPAAEEALLNFLLDNFYLPQSVWQVLDETFDFSQRTEELYENWPREFVDHGLISGIRTEPSLDYYLFTPGINAADCDAYRRLYFQANNMPLLEAGPVLDQMEQLTESHPFGIAMRCRFRMENGEPEEGREGFAQLVAQYPDHPLLVSTWAGICFEDGKVEEAEQLAQHILSIDPEFVEATVVVAKCLAGRNAYKKAKELLYDTLRISEDKPILVRQLVELIQQWNEKMILLCEEKFASEPEDFDNILELAWCYMQNERIDDAFAVAQKLDPSCEDQYAYHNLVGKLYYNTEQYETALSHMRTLEEIVRNMTDDGTAETRKRISRLPEILQIQGSCLLQMGQTDQAYKHFELALAENPDDIDLLSAMARILYAAGDYAHAVEVLSRLRQLTSSAWFETLMAICLYRLRRDREAFDAVERGLMLPDWDLTLYLVKMQILCRNGVFEGVHEILDYMKENNAPEDIALDFIRAELVQLEKEDEATALKQYRALAKRVEAGESLFFHGELYYQLAVLTGNQLDVSLSENRRTVLELIDKGLQEYDRDADLLDYKAWVLKQGGLLNEAIEMYSAILRKDPDSAIALRGIADLYYGDLGSYASQALHYYEKLLETQKIPELYYFAAFCKRYLGDLDGARYYFLKQQEMDPEDIDALQGLGYVCDALGELENSLAYANQALDIMQQYQQRNDWVVEHKLNVLRRLGRYEEALAFAQDAAQRFRYADSMQARFDICCQFGLWEQAKQVLDDWKRQNRNDPNLMEANARLCLLQGKMFGATLAMGPAKGKLSYDKVLNFRLQLADLECNQHRKIELLSYRVNRDRTDDASMTQLAHAYWLAGDLNAARGAAVKSLELIDSMLAKNSVDEPIYRTRRALALAILGRFEEAVQEIEKSRKMPQCEFCTYHCCKDADIFEAYIAEIAGETDRAREYFTAGKANWPDELDFVAGEKRLNRKGRK